MREPRQVPEENVRLIGLNPNLAFEEIPTLANISKQGWVITAIEKNPHERFWQYHFNCEEAKNGHPVHAILPRQVNELLGAYLRASGYCWLWGRSQLNNKGRPFDRSTTRTLITQIALKWVGRRVTPHAFRDILALQYLEDRPEDYLTLSKILWHRNLQTTL